VRPAQRQFLHSPTARIAEFSTNGAIRTDFQRVSGFGAQSAYVNGDKEIKKK